jgi:hypothetical protein
MYFGVMYIAMEPCGADYLYKRDRKRKRRYKSSPLSLCLLFLNTCRGTAAQTANMAVTGGRGCNATFLVLAKVYWENFLPFPFAVVRFALYVKARENTVILSLHFFFQIHICK